MLLILQFLLVVVLSVLGLALAVGAATHAPAIFGWIQERLESIPNAVKRLSGRQRKLQRAERARALDKERTEQYRAALEDEWDAKAELHVKWMDEYRELTATPHALSCKFTVRGECKDAYTECTNPIEIGTWAKPNQFICGCGGKKPTPAPGLKYYFRPWHVVDLPKLEPLPELVGPVNPFRKAPSSFARTNQRKFEAARKAITPGYATKIRSDHPSTVKKLEAFQKQVEHEQEMVRRLEYAIAAGVSAQPKQRGPMAQQYAIDAQKTMLNYQPQIHGPYHHSTDL